MLEMKRAAAKLVLKNVDRNKRDVYNANNGKWVAIKKQLLQKKRKENV
jgi:hypothetical protein